MCGACRHCQDAESLGFASLVVSNVNLLPRLKKLPMSYRLASKAFLRQLKVLLKLFQKLAVSKGRAFGGF